MAQGTLLFSIEVPFEKKERGNEWVFWIFHNNITSELYIFGKRRILKRGESDADPEWKEILFRGKEPDCFAFLATLIGKNLVSGEILFEVNMGIYSINCSPPIICSNKYIKDILFCLKKHRDELVFYEKVQMTSRLFSEFVGYLKSLKL